MAAMGVGGQRPPEDTQAAGEPEARAGRECNHGARCVSLAGLEPAPPAALCGREDRGDIQCPQLPPRGPDRRGLVSPHQLSQAASRQRGAGTQGSGAACRDERPPAGCPAPCPFLYLLFLQALHPAVCLSVPPVIKFLILIYRLTLINSPRSRGFVTVTHENMINGGWLMGTMAVL